MKILNFGSLNIDHVYEVKDFVQPGETIQSLNYYRFAGGKGLNQSIALSRAGVNVLHAGKIGVDGKFLLEFLEKENIDCSLIEVSENQSTGHAIIQVSQSGQNCIVLHGGANLSISNLHVSRVIEILDKNDYLILQNEINNIGEIMQLAYNKGVNIFFNPAPMNDKCFTYPIHLIDTIIVNENEAKDLSKCEENWLEQLKKLYPNSNILITMGANGIIYYNKKDDVNFSLESLNVENVIDTTAAGDTFIGYFIAFLSITKDYKKALKIATKAAGITITKKGAAESIPHIKDIIN